jgi:hypothetical protein
MTKKYTPGSFTKNFSWNESYERLHNAIGFGFSGGSMPVTRDTWRTHSKIHDGDRELIPMNFFLYSVLGTKEDYLLVDQLVDAAADPYNAQFTQLALFSFHMAKSGKWRKSSWYDGRVAGWANDFILAAWDHDDWAEEAFSDERLFAFIERHVEAEAVTQRKVFTNYRYMLKSAGILDEERLQPNNLRQRWFVDAVQLVWDREIFDGTLNPTASLRTLESTLIDKEIYKLLRCSKDQCRAFARAAFAEFSQGQGPERAKQLQTLRDTGAIAA